MHNFKMLKHLEGFPKGWNTPADKTARPFGLFKQGTFWKASS
jgi:hypothetical protein